MLAHLLSSMIVLNIQYLCAHAECLCQLKCDRYTHSMHAYIHTYKIHTYIYKSGNFRYMKFSLENFRVEKIFVGSSYESILTQKFYNIAS